MLGSWGWGVQRVQLSQMLSLLAPKVHLLLCQLRRHPTEALQLVRARLLGPLWIHQAEQSQAEGPQAQQQASLVKL